MKLCSILSQEEDSDGPSRPLSRRSTKLTDTIMTKKTSDKWYMEKHPDKLAVLLGRLYVFAFTWSIGGTLNR